MRTTHIGRNTLGALPRGTSNMLRRVMSTAVPRVAAAAPESLFQSRAALLLKTARAENADTGSPSPMFAPEPGISVRAEAAEHERAMKIAASDMLVDAFTDSHVLARSATA